ncbi:MAG TPA: FkbM family methyltransferase [Chitinophagaceae bacterium]|nr:FkbM family methyltransferase [Chitinophagaceae bacterium]
MLKKLIPDFLKIWLKQLAYRLYLLSSRFFKGPFDKYDFQAIQIFRTCLAADAHCIDVGAHAGHILREILKAAPRGKHWAIEPIPDLCQLVQKKYGKRVSVHNLALSDSEGSVSFAWYPDRPALSGFKERAQAGDYKASVITVQTRRLDDLIPSNEKIDLIKIDVEGAEWQVLQGALRILTESKPIVLFETGMGGADEYNTSPEQIFDLFESCGLSLTLMEYYLEGRKPLDKHEFCGHFYKRYNYFFMAYKA